MAVHDMPGKGRPLDLGKKRVGFIELAFDDVLANILEGHGFPITRPGLLVIDLIEQPPEARSYVIL
jgi:hypothetical protein